MNMKRFTSLTALGISVFVLLSLSLFASAGAAGFPEKTITIICHSAAGSPVDVMSRQLATEASKIPGVTVVVETKTGGSGAVAMAYLLTQKADGHTIYAMTRSNADLFAGGKIKDFKWDDLVYFLRVQQDPYILAASPSAPFKTAKEMIEYGKKNPGAIKVGGFGSGSAHHFMGITFAQKAGIEITWVPYPGGSEAIMAVLGGHIPVVHSNPGVLLKHFEAGTLIPLAVSVAERIKDLPNTPTYKELGIDMNESHFRGLAAKKGVPADRLKALHDIFKKAMETPEFKAYTEKSNLVPGYMGMEEFNKYFGNTVNDNIELQKKVGK
jgi:tripartite-type tricarboxylate transporter receptor subunit TctC